MALSERAREHAGVGQVGLRDDGAGDVHGGATVASRRLRAALTDTSRRMAKPPPPRIHIQYPQPVVDAGRYPAKRTVGDLVEVSADVFRDGHEKLRAVAVYRCNGGRKWHEAELHALDAHINGVRWGGSFVVDKAGRWEYSIEAWTDVFATWRDELRRKLEGGQHDLSGELSEGVVLLEDVAQRAKGADRKLIEHALRVLTDEEILEAAKHDAALGMELLAAV